VPRLRPDDPRVRARAVWPFFWAGIAYDQFAVIAARGNFDLALCVRPDALVPHHEAIAALTAYVAATGDRTVGLRAGQSLRPGDWDIVECVARSAHTLREAIDCAARFASLLNEAITLTLMEEERSALWRFDGRAGTPRHVAADDFLLSGVVTLISYHVGDAARPREVHFAHAPPLDRRPYDARFETTVRFGMPHNAVLLDLAQLDLPMLGANDWVHGAFEAYARELLEHRAVGVRRRVAELAAEELRAGTLTMTSVARRFGASPATLRRRLEDEGTTFRDLVGDVRRDLAELYLGDPRRTISEIAFALGFSSVGAFHRAFRRWTAATPSAFRARLQRD
jgi:AraC-like DNA-binding protein